MGIEGLRSFFFQKYRSAFTPARRSRKENFDHVCVDFNSFIHIAAREASKSPGAKKRKRDPTNNNTECNTNNHDDAKNEQQHVQDGNNTEQAEQQTEKKKVHVEQDFDTWYPRFELYLMRKMRQILLQFPARQSLFFAMDGPGPDSKVAEQRERRFKKTTGFGVHISPGTGLMNRVKKCIENFAIMYLGLHQQMCPDLAVIISGSDHPGEGEIKVNGFINEHVAEGETVLVISEDSDALLLSISTLRKNVKLLVDRHIFHLSRFAVIMQRQLGHDEQSIALLDFLCMQFFRGNDYSRWMANTERLMRDYNPNRFSENNSNKYRYLIKPVIITTTTKNVQGEVISTKTDRSITFDLENLLQLLDKNAQTRREGDETAVQNTKQYLEFLLWNLDMYLSGRCTDYGFIPPGKWDRNLAYGIETLLSRGEIILPPRKANSEPLSLYECCMALFPPFHHGVLPAPVKKLIEQHPELAEFLTSAGKDIDLSTLRRHTANVQASLAKLSEVELQQISFVPNTVFALSKASRFYTVIENPIERNLSYRQLRDSYNIRAFVGPQKHMSHEDALHKSWEDHHYRMRSSLSSTFDLRANTSHRRITSSLLTVYRSETVETDADGVTIGSTIKEISVHHTAPLLSSTKKRQRDHNDNDGDHSQSAAKEDTETNNSKKKAKKKKKKSKKRKADAISQDTPGSTSATTLTPSSSSSSFSSKDNKKKKNAHQQAGNTTGESKNGGETAARTATANNNSNARDTSGDDVIKVKNQKEAKRARRG